MNKGFWNNLAQPFFALAPMEDVTDVAFRAMFAKYGRYKDELGRLRGPDIMWTEFVSADGLFLADERGQEIIRRDLLFDERERPIVAQFFSCNPELMKRAAGLAAELGFDGVDINMGCPSKTVVGNGAGCAMIKKPAEAQEIIVAAKEGARGFPVSVKTRIGFNKNDIETWLPEILSTKPAAVILHARTRKDMSKVPAKWNVISRAVEIRNELAPEVLIVGNGDVDSLQEAEVRVKETGCDGIMVGRGVFGNPWFFNPYINRDLIPLEERLNVLVEHTYLFEEKLGDVKNFATMKKHFKAYISGFPGARELRRELMKTNCAEEVEQILGGFVHGRKSEMLV